MACWGIANKLFKPNGIEGVRSFLKSLPKDEPLLWLGLGSNSLIRETGFAGTVILTQGCLNQIEVIAPNLVRVEAGVSSAKMARFCARNNLVGGEFWAGIPGTIGGSLRMNAGCNNKETWQLVTEVETINRQGEISHRKPEEFKISYRHVEGLSQDEWFVAATCRLTPGNKEESLDTIKTLLAHRAATQPTNEHSCGSVFRNPPGQFAAKLIEQCGLKGKRIGQAVVSTKHANFIINEGQAKANEIESLMEFVHETVHKETGIDMIREVHIIGEK